MKRLLEFSRSVIPEDPWQLLYLAGAVFLFLSPRMRWSFQTEISFGFIALAMIPVVFAGMFAYYGCFRPGEHPLRRISLAVFLPALLGICLLIGEFTFLKETNRSLFARRPGLADFLHEGSIVFKGHPTGFTFSWIALAMLGVFTIRMYLGISSLPLRLGGPSGSENESEPWNNILMLIFVLVCPLFLLRQFTGILFSIPTWYWYRADGAGFSVYMILTEVLNPLLLVLLAILILGKSGISSARSSLRLPEPRFAVFGLMLPILIAVSISSFRYGQDRVQWATHDGFRNTFPPQFADYFSLGDSWRWALVTLIFAAFAEEIVFRGMLLQPLVRRYGLHRGVFFTGLVWAAFHFHGEMHLRYTMTEASLQLASRIAICLAMNYVLSWTTLRWNSVIPAGIAHTVSNVLVVGRLNGGIPFANEMRIVLWAICAFVVFHNWPVQAKGGEEAAPPVPSPEPVV